MEALSTYHMQNWTNLQVFSLLLFLSVFFFFSLTDIQIIFNICLTSSAHVWNLTTLFDFHENRTNNSQTEILTRSFELMAHFTKNRGNFLHISEGELINCVFFLCNRKHHTLHSKTAFQSIFLNKGNSLLEKKSDFSR